MNRRQLQTATELVDEARIECERYRNIMQIVLDERKRPPYLNADELDTVVGGIDDTISKLHQALEELK